MLGGFGPKRVAVLALGLALAALVAPSAAGAAACGKDAGDEAAIAAVVAAARASCPCDSFAKRPPYRLCVRGFADAAIDAGQLRKSCRGAVLRFANRSTCGAREGAVACCRETASGREICGIAVSAARCRAPHGGSARLGGTESCHDACLPPPTPTPLPQLTPTPGAARCCGCGCAPPYYLNCPGSQHQCSLPAPGATTPSDCDAFDIPGQLDCEFFTECNAVSGGISFPYCTGLP